MTEFELSKLIKYVSKKAPLFYMFSLKKDGLTREENPQRYFDAGRRNKWYD